MYDYITISDSAEQSKVILAYSEPQNGIRRCEYLAEKTYGKFSKTEFYTTGESRTDIITRTDFIFACGLAFGEISCRVPKE